MGSFTLYHDVLVSAGAWVLQPNNKDYALPATASSTIRFAAGTTSNVWALDGASYANALPFGLLPSGFAIATASLQPGSSITAAGSAQWFVQWDVGTESANRSALTLPIPTTPSLLQTNGVGCRGVGDGTFGVTYTQPLPSGATGGNATIVGTYETVCLITGISPARGPVGTLITITGVGFDSGSTVTIGGVSVSTLTFVSSTTLLAVAPANGAVVVTKSDGSISKVPVTITGRGFNCGITSLTVCGTKATDLVVVNDTTLTANVRSGSGICNVVITDSANQTATALAAFRFGLAPC